MNFKLEIAKLINEQIINNHLDLSEDFLDLISQNSLEKLVEIPTDSDKGDFCIPCFRFSKELKLAPNVISEKLCALLNQNKKDFIKEVVPTGAYINFFVDEAFFASYVMGQVINDVNYGKSSIGNNQKVVIDYSAPNIAKPFHVGHLRSTVIGNALYNIYNTLGYQSYGINYLGDWGTQFGKLIVAYKKWGNKDLVIKDGITELNRIYVKFHQEADKDESLNEQAREYLVKMQDGDEDALSLWTWFKDISLLEFEKVYKKLGVTFDSYRGESYYNDKMMPIVNEIDEKGLLQLSNGAKIVDLEEYKMPPCLILRSDGGTLYPTRDISAAIDRYNDHNFYKCIYITGMDQNLHFKQWFKVIDLMGYPFVKDLVHVPFGLVSFDSGKLSTRNGNVILMEDLLDEAVNKTLEIIKQNENMQLDNEEEVAKEVGIGAIIFNDLYNSRIKDVIFNWERILNFDGETGPYVQYTHARCYSILNKCNDFDINKVDYKVLSDKSSMQVLKLIYEYPNKIEEAALKYEPYILTRHIMEITKAFNKFYHDNKVNVEDDTIRNSRIMLVMATKQVIKNGLTILGIKAPNKM